MEKAIPVLCEFGGSNELVQLTHDNPDAAGIEVLSSLYKEREDREGRTIMLLCRLLEASIQQNVALKRFLRSERPEDWRKFLMSGGNEKI